jgi:Zn-dependent oligopeptidase
MDLDVTQRDKVKEGKEKMSELSTEYSKNCNEENASFTVPAGELKGACVYVCVCVCVCV